MRWWRERLHRTVIGSSEARSNYVASKQGNDLIASIEPPEMLRHLDSGGALRLEKTNHRPVDIEWTFEDHFYSKRGAIYEY
uniref:Uncharacterized protein n=1 Tax=Candidatus Kentrum eta TaxID=2126337 RepID=A0A450VIK5_9GAMM|nr:MAG: hypothetical protein BECKH772A_GA0070896_104441 [Candidatus Kentron sp. H]